MDSRIRKLHDIEKQSVIEEPTEAKMLIESDKEMQLHRIAKQILERHVKDIEDFKSNLDGSTCPVLSEADQALVDASNTLILKRFMLLFQEFGKAFVYYGDPTAEWQFWIRLLWLISETQKSAVQSMAENEVLDAPDFFKETGMRIGECISLNWTALNEQANILTLNNPEKNSLPRIFNISPKLVTILQSLPKINEKIFGLTRSEYAQRNFSRSRRKIAKKVGNPRLAKIHFHLIRHWFGTMEYHKKPDPDYVRRRLVHKSLQSTQIYINMEQALFSTSSNEYHVKIAESVEQAMALIEVGFEYITGEYNDGGKIFKKRK